MLFVLFCGIKILYCMKNDLEKDDIKKLVLAIALPSMFAQFISVLYSIVDRIYIGHLPTIGAYALAGVGISGPILTMISAFASLIGVGGAPLASIAMGEKNNEKAKQIIGNAFLMMIVISIAVVIVLYPFSEKMLRLFGASETTITYALTYFKIYLLGTPFSLLATGMNNFINCQGYAKTGMISVLVGAITNIILDPILMFGFNLSVSGAAIATVISQFMSCIFVISVLKSNKLTVKLELVKLDIHTCMDILKIGFTQFVIIAFDNVMLISMNAILQYFGGESLGDTLITANTIIQSFMLVLTMPLGGISAGTQCILSYNYGAYKADRVKEAMHYIAITCITYCTIMFIASWTIGKYFIYLFTTDEVIVHYALNALHIITLFIIPLGYQYAAVDGMTALGQVKISLPLSFFRKTVYFIALFFLPYFFGAEMTFGAESLSDIIAPIVTYIVVKRSIDPILQWRMNMQTK